MLTMAELPRDHWLSLEPLLDEALDLPPAERARWLHGLAARSPVLAAEIDALISRESAADRDGFLLPSTVAGLEGLELGPWRLTHPLGQGGMGSVWLARRVDGRFEGVAAVKLLHLALHGTEGQARFRREGSLLARLTHPGIARLLDAGVTPSGSPYLVLEYVDGAPIDEYVRNHRLTIPACVRLFQQVLAAVGHAHAALIVHRDLKPTNILVTAAGTVKLLDFGIARLLDDQPGDRAALTQEGGGAFTPHYAAPEQVRHEPLTTAVDVYALGVLLYQLLSGRHPTAGEAMTPAACLAALLEVEPPRLGLGDLDTILAKALRKVAAERYLSVGAFADDLARYLGHEPIGARPPSLGYRMERFIRRNRAGVLAGGVMVLSLLGATAFSVAQMREARRQRDAAVAARRRSDAQVEFQESLLSQVGDRPITVAEMVDSARAVVTRQFAHDSATLGSLLPLLANAYARLGETRERGALLARAESLAAAGYGVTELPEIYCMQVDNLRMEGRYSEAWRRLAEADSLRQRRPDPRQEASCLGARAALEVEAHITGSAPTDAPDGTATSRRALFILDSLGDTRGPEYLALLDDLATALDVSNRPREAVAVFRRVLEWQARAGMGSSLDHTMASHNLALALVKLGETAAADSLLRQVLDQAAASDPSGRIYWQPLIHYAEIALTVGRADTALKYFRQVVRQAVADTNLYWEGRGLFGVGRAAATVGRAAEANAAANRLERLVARYPHAQDTDDVVPDPRTIRGMLALAAGDPGAAWTAFDAVLRQHGYFEGRKQSRLRPVALLAAEAGIAEGRLEAAADLVRLAGANALLDPIADSASAAVAEVRLVEALLALARGDTTLAGATFDRAVAGFSRGAGPDDPRTRRALARRAMLPS